MTDFRLTSLRPSRKRTGERPSCYHPGQGCGTPKGRVIHALLLSFVMLGAAAAAAAAVFAAHTALVPRTFTVATIRACPGIRGVERCLREQYVAQGAPSPSITCATAKMPGYSEYSCIMDVGLGGGCYAVAAHRSKQDGYPIIDATAQMATC